MQRVRELCGGLHKLVCGRCKQRETDPGQPGDNGYIGPASLDDADPDRITMTVSGSVRVKALFDFEPLQAGDLAFSRGDILEIVERDNDDWWEAMHLTTNKTGTIPSTYVTVDSDDVEAQIWFDRNRDEAETLLMLPGNPRGTFMLRPSRDGKSSVLSIRNFDQSTSDFDIKHYRIKCRKDQYFILSRMTFPSLAQLVEHYKKSADCLCCRLVTVCPSRPELVPFKKLEVPHSEIKLEEKLGKGKFGEVWKGIWKGRLEVAVKMMSSISMMTVDEFIAEAEILHKLRHRRLVLLMGVCTVEQPVYIIMELLPLGALNDFLKSSKGLTLKFPQLMDFAAQIAEGMAFVENRNYIHRDLRAANVLVGDSNNVKIADLGLARLLKEDEYNASSGNFPIKWTAPEAANDRRFSIKSDVWSFGILLYEIVTYGRQPYPGMTNRETLDALEQNYRMPNPTKGHIHCPEELYDMMLDCWSEEPSERPSFQDLEMWFNAYCAKLEVPYSLEDENDAEEADD